MLVVAVAVALLSFFPKDTVILQAGGLRYTLRISSTPQEQHLGLGKRSSLPEDQGMLFAFDTAATQCFWMKDMHFPLDIIWVSSDKKVDYIMNAVSPTTYPHVFCPKIPAKYVIELNAGQAKRASIHTGGVLEF